MTSEYIVHMLKIKVKIEMNDPIAAYHMQPSESTRFGILTLIIVSAVLV